MSTDTSAEAGSRPKDWDVSCCGLNCAKCVLLAKGGLRWLQGAAGRALDPKLCVPELRCGERPPLLLRV